MSLHEIYLAAQLAKSDSSSASVALSDYYTKSQTDDLISAKVNEQTAINRSILGYQSKNLLKNMANTATLNGVTVNNLTFKPMLRYDKISDDTYEPYKLSIDDRIANLEARITALEAKNQTNTVQEVSYD